MSRDTFGTAITLSLFGESHGPAIGCTIEGIRPGMEIDSDFMDAQLLRRQGAASLSTARREPDAVRFLSGVYQGRATGTALCLSIENTDVQSGAYQSTANLLRPSHADYTARRKYGGFSDPRGGGHFSGRLTAPLVAAGSIFLSLLREKGVRVATRLQACGGVEDAVSFGLKPEGLSAQMGALCAASFPTLSPDAGVAMGEAIRAAAREGDSVGGVLETAVLGLPPGLGEPFFGSVESQLSALLFSMPAVKGVEFGLGFGLAALRGSMANDSFCMDGNAIVTATNHNGGINGGITNGMPLLLRTAIKPTPSIFLEQDTVDFIARQNAKLSMQGRHDPCIAHRAAVVQDSLVAFGLCDLFNAALGLTWQGGPHWPKEAPWNMA
ncbi:MAG: chorismate synthase [Clostridia bacterium]|nr:chorismate synthase [Clostridia bacterium]